MLPKRDQDLEDLPLASASGGINDGLALLDLTETRSILQKQLIISGRVQATEVDILVALDAVLKALVQSLALLGSGENGRDSSRNLGILLDESAKLSLGNPLDLGVGWANHSRHSELLGGWGSVAGTVSGEDARTVVSVGHASKEGSTRGRLGRSGGVRSSTVVKSGDIAKSTIHAVTVGGTARSVGDHVGAISARNSSLLNVVATRDTASVNGIGSLDTHVEGTGDASIGSVVDDRSISRHVASGRHGNWSSALRRKVTIS